MLGLHKPAVKSRLDRTHAKQGGVTFLLQTFPNAACTIVPCAVCDAPLLLLLLLLLLTFTMRTLR